MGSCRHENGSIACRVSHVLVTLFVSVISYFHNPIVPQSAAQAAEGDSVLLATKNTSLALLRQNGAWNVAHYGAKVSSIADAEALAWNRWAGDNSIAQRRPAAYAAYGGDKDGGYGFNKWGGLQVVHADGCLTLHLVGEDAETVPDADGAKHIVLKQRDRVYPFYVTQHFRALESCDVIETWVELKNDEDGAVRLGRMDSYAMGFPLLANAFRMQYTTGQWASEAQLRETPVERGQSVMIGSRSGVRDAWENNASFMLTVGDVSTEKSGRVIGGVLCWSGAWSISVQRDQCDFLEIRAGADTSAGAYVLDAGKSITLPKFAFTFSDSGKGQISRNMHRWARDWQLPAGGKLRPVLLNSWEGSYFSFTENTLIDMMDGVEEMGGELFVLDDGWFGTGKYARDDKNRDTTGLGDWVVNPEKLPHGLVGLSGEAKKRGLKFGFWVEPEMVNTNSWLYEEHPDWVIRERKRPVNTGRGGSQTVLDFSNPAVRDNIYSQLDALCSKTPDLAYIKWDANADFYNIGSAYLDAAHQANLPFDYTVGLYDLLTKLKAKYPNVDIQACSSGGGHVDYGFLRYADEFWGSDDSDARERVFIQWGESQFYPACTIAAHVTDVPNHQTGRTTPLKFRFDVAMSARLGFELHPKNMSAEDVAFAKKCVADYKRIRPTVQQGDLYRLVSPYGSSYAALMYVNDDASHAVVFLWGLVRGRWSDFVPPLMLQGLDDGKSYRVREINVAKERHCRVDGKTLDGRSLMAMGLPVRLKGDYDSAVFELTAVSPSTPAPASSCAATYCDLPPFPEWSEPRRVTEGPHEHFLASYFAIDSWSPDKRYMLVLETDVNGRLPEPGERCTIGVVDLCDGNRFVPFSTTACWNFQEAAMAHWIDNDTVLFNDLRDGKFKAVVMDWRSGKDIRVLPMPVSAVSEDRTWAVSVNYARLSLLRPDYGYAGAGQDARESVPWPEDDGLWTMDLKTGETNLILSVAATRPLQPEPKAVPGKPGQPLAYHCHTVISKDGEKIFFLARSVDWFDKATHEIPYWNTTSFTVNRDGTDLRRCFKDGWAGSHFNWAPDGSHKMLVTATWNERNDPELPGRAWSAVEFEVGREDDVRRIGAGILDLDWHCVYSPDGRFMSGETYWNKYYERPWVLVRLADGMTKPMGSFYVPPAYRGGYWRCDLHARYRPDGRQIAFNSVHEGSRQVYVRDIEPCPPRTTPLNDGWTADGTPVTLPHCWNVDDGTDGPVDRNADMHDSVGGSGYERRKVVYAHDLPPAAAGKVRHLRVNAASIHATVRVDGREIGRHSGAFTAFTLELPQSGRRLEIEVDNFYDPDVPPVCGDFTMHGGLYRGVELIESDASRRFVAEDGLFEDELAAPRSLPRYELRDDGFYVDGRKTFLKGVCYHQDREGKGWAISADDEESDIRLIKEMGANAIRTSHYPRSERFYDLCDKYGIYVWTELPLVDATTDSAAFRENTLKMAREMVLQLRRHKCIAMWGIFNELYLKEMPEGQAEPLVREVRELVKSLDPRPVVAASNNPDKKELNAIPDALGFNMYPGWYGGESSDLGRLIEEWRLENGRTSVAVSEYGAGGSVGQIEYDGTRPSPHGRYHPLEYQLRHHRESWAAIKDNPHVWGAFVWVMFDCGSDARREGARDGLNDKGLVGFDHKTRKPVYDFYKTEWNEGR